MKAYIGTKLINAKPMTLGNYNLFRGWELPEGEKGLDEGYLVEYLDGGKANTSEYEGYVSWSPKNVFEKAYKASGELSFGAAIELMKQGNKVARKGWNGKGMFIFYVPENAYPASGNKNGTLVGHFENDLVPYNAYIAMKTAQDTVVPWLASQSDIIMEDWVIVS